MTWERKRKCGPNGIEWNEDRKCKVKVKRKGNHNSNNPETWHSLLPTLEFAYNSKPHATQKESPFYLQMGYDPKAIPTTYPKTNLPETQDRLLILQEAWKEAEAAHELARQKMMERIT